MVVFAPSFMRMNPALETELKLLESTTATRTTSTKGQGPGEKLLTLVFFCLFACLLLFFLEEGISEMLQILMASIELCIFMSGDLDLVYIKLYTFVLFDPFSVTWE